jgi:ABC-type multidrug transport system fused ATPase/permease subunit
MRLLKELLKRYLRQGLVLLVITVALTSLGVVTIELGRIIINAITASSGQGNAKDYHNLLVYCGIMLLVILINGAMNYWINILFTQITQSVLRDIRLKLFNHIMQLPQDFFNKNPVGSVMSLIIDDVSSIGQFFSKVFLLPIMNIMMIVFYTVYIFFLNWKLAIAAIITIPVIVIILPRLNRRLIKLTERYSDSVSDMSSYFQEAFSGIGDIRLSQTYVFEEAKLKEKTTKFFDINLNLAMTTGAFSFLAKVVRRIGPLLVYLYGGILCLKGEVTVGTLVAGIAVVNSLYDPVDSFVTFIQEWKQARVQFDKIDEYFSLKPEVEALPDQEKQPAFFGDINFDNVRFGFNDKDMLLKDICFTADSGRHLAFVGTSGSGKSLTSALITRIYKPLGGHIIFGKDDVNSIRLHELRSRIGHVSQTPFLFNDTIKKNIIYALLRKKGADSSRIEEWIDFSLLDDIDSLEKLDKEIIGIIKQVGLWDDIYELGLRSRLQGALAEDDNETKVIKARKVLLEDNLSRQEQYLEHYDENKFMEYCSIIENITFCPTPAITEEFGSTKEFSKLHLNEQLKESGILDKLFNIGIQMAREDNFLLGNLYKKKSRLLEHLGFNRTQVEKRVQINQEVSIGQEGSINMKDLDQSQVADILDLAYSYIPGKSKQDLLDEKIKNDIIAVRRTFKNNLPRALEGKLKFFDPDKYLDSMGIRENICFGNVNPLRQKASSLVNDLIKKIARDSELDELILKLGLEFNVGERGSRLSGGQRQKVSIARILLKNPSILILDEATASLDASSQACITELIRERFNGKIVISIAHRLNTVKDFDKIIVFDRGEIVQQGSFDELIANEGLFKKLYSESN